MRLYRPLPYITIALNTYFHRKKPETKLSTTTTSVEAPDKHIPSTSGQAIQQDSPQVGQSLDILDDPLLSPRAVRQTEQDVVVPTIQKKKQEYSVISW